MIVGCGPGDMMRCFKPGAEFALSAARAGASTIVSAGSGAGADIVGVVDFPSWGRESTSIPAAGGAVSSGVRVPSPRDLTEGAMQRAATRGYARIGPHGNRELDLRTGVSRQAGANGRAEYSHHPNIYARRLHLERDLWTAIVVRGGLTGLCCPSTRDQPPPWVSMPSEGRRFQQIGSILLPAVEGTDSLVTSIRVPDGFDGVIVSVVNMYTGSGFVEGSGDLHYRIQINRRWVKDYGDIQTTLGSVSAPCAIYRGGIQLRTHEVVRYWVQLGAGALGRLDPAARIVCALFGWYYPQV